MKLEAMHSGVAFVASVNKEGSMDSIACTERMAVLDDNGTLWAKQPLYFDLVSAMDRVRLNHPQSSKDRLDKGTGEAHAQARIVLTVMDD